VVIKNVIPSEVVVGEGETLMDKHKVQIIIERMKDERSKKVIFVSHCLLNENTRYLGGAFRPGCVDEIVDELQRQGTGIVQMPCPEQRAWGGVLKRHVLLGLGAGNAWLYKFRGLIMALFVWNTKRVFGKIARQVAKEIKDYLDSGFEVVGIVGVDGSPCCGVNVTLDMEKSFDFLSGLDLEALDREAMNEYGVANCLVEGEGWFVEALRKGLRRKGLEIRFYAHDLVAEMRGEIRLFLPSQ
jgi:predicted secreted protein